MRARAVGLQLQYIFLNAELKNKIIMFSYEDEHGEGREGLARELIEEIVEFNRNYKRKPKKFRKIGSSY